MDRGIKFLFKYSYQSEDLTGQRRSIKCYPFVAKETPVAGSSITSSIGATMMSIIVVVIVALLVAAGGFFVFIKRKNLLLV